MAGEPTVRDVFNPIRAYKDARGLSYEDLAAELGVSLDYAKKLGSGSVLSVRPATAKRFEILTRGAITYEAVMRWVEANLDLDELEAECGGR